MSREYKKQIHAFRRQFVCGKIRIFAKGWWLLQKKGKEVDKIDMIKNHPPPFFFLLKKGIIDQKLREKSEKNSPDALQLRFLA